MFVSNVEGFMFFSFCTALFTACLIALSSVVFALPVSNFDSEQEIRGRVADQNNASVVGAKIVASNTATKHSATTVTDERGDFTLVLGPGEYVLEVRAKG